MRRITKSGLKDFFYVWDPKLEGGSGYGGYGGYNKAYSSARVVGIRSVERRSNTTTRVRGYASSGVAMNYGGYGGYGYAQPQADLSFKCDIDYRGYIRDIDINRR